MLQRPEISDKDIPVGALYIHVPFCIVKCSYCDFYSLADREHQADAFLDSVEKELHAACAGGRPALKTIFMGGGTPTRLTAPQLERLAAVIGSACDLSALDEWTVEANPATLDHAKAQALLAAGADRISFGAQSFADAELKFLGREHDAASIGDSVRLARAAGFPRLNLDLIFGLPGQSFQRWEDNLERAIALEPEHISCYSLTYEPGTELTRRMKEGRVVPADPELERRMYDHTRGRLAAAGYAQYEISNFARPGEECRHNLVYWHNESYLGLGPSAVSYVNGFRRKNVVNLDRWLAETGASGSAVASSERLEGKALAGETAMLNLRLREGIDVGAFRRRHGLDPRELFAEPIRRFTATGLLEADAERIRITDAGLFVSDGIMSEFVA